jgi:hypothetical protein
MSLTERRENGLLKAELVASATNLFHQVLETLEKNEGLKKALVQQFLNSPHLPQSPDAPRQIKFKSGENEYSLNIQRSVWFEEISLIKMVDRIENKLTIWIQYDEITQGHCSLFGGTKRGEISNAHMSYLEFDWNDSGKSIMYVNNKEASERVLKLLRQV